MTTELQEKLKQHVDGGCQIAMALQSMYDHVKDHTSRDDFVRALDALGAAVLMLHLDADAKIMLVAEQADAQTNAIKYLAAALDRLADSRGRAPGGPSDPRVN